jgi:hypothetical protein
MMVMTKMTMMITRMVMMMMIIIIMIMSPSPQHVGVPAERPLGVVHEENPQAHRIREQQAEGHRERPEPRRTHGHPGLDSLDLRPTRGRLRLQGRRRGLAAYAEI